MQVPMAATIQKSLGELEHVLARGSVAEVKGLLRAYIGRSRWTRKTARPESVFYACRSGPSNPINPPPKVRQSVQ